MIDNFRVENGQLLAPPPPKPPTPTPGEPATAGILGVKCANNAGGEKRRRHGMKKTPEWRAWMSMRNRCRYKDNASWERYGGKGITVCERWDSSFENFLEDMGRMPEKGYTIERKDSSRNYEPDNCRWASRKEQSRNRPTYNLMCTIRGETKCLAEWVEQYGAKRHIVLLHIKNGLSIEDALVSPGKQDKAYTAFGESKTLSEWAASSGIKYITLHARVTRMGLSMEEALKLPLVRGRRIKK